MGTGDIIRRCREIGLTGQVTGQVAGQVEPWTLLVFKARSLLCSISQSIVSGISQSVNLASPV